MTHLHDVTFPDKYDLASTFADKKLGNVELNGTLSDPKKLALYALRNYVDKGPCKDPCPSMFYLRDRYKYQAWKAVESMNRFEAMVMYVEHLEEVLGKDWVDEALGPVGGGGGSIETMSSPPDASLSTQPPSFTASGGGGFLELIEPGQGSPADQMNQAVPPGSSTVARREEELSQSPLSPPESPIPLSNNIAELQAEVARLRFLLQESGIDYRTGSPLPPKQYQAILRGGAVRFLPPPAESNFPGTSSSSQSNQRVASPAPRQILASVATTEGDPKVVPAKVVNDRPQLTQPAVYYGANKEAHKVGWLEWLGLGSSKVQTSTQKSVDGSPITTDGSFRNQDRQKQAAESTTGRNVSL